MEVNILVTFLNSDLNKSFVFIFYYFVISEMTFHFICHEKLISFALYTIIFNIENYIIFFVFQSLF